MALVLVCPGLPQAQEAMYAGGEKPRSNFVIAQPPRGGQPPGFNGTTITLVITRMDVHSFDNLTEERKMRVRHIRHPIFCASPSNGHGAETEKYRAKYYRSGKLAPGALALKPDEEEKRPSSSHNLISGTNRNLRHAHVSLRLHMLRHRQCQMWQIPPRDSPLSILGDNGTNLHAVVLSQKVAVNSSQAEVPPPAFLKRGRVGDKIRRHICDPPRRKQRLGGQKGALRGNSGSFPGGCLHDSQVANSSLAMTPARLFECQQRGRTAQGRVRL